MLDALSHGTPVGRSTGLLLVGHGTRSRQGTEEFLTFARLVGERSAVPVEPAFLELAEPTIVAGLGRLLRRGVEHVVVAPLLLLAAAHAKRDIPEAVVEALTASGAAEVTTEQVGHLGCQPAILELSARRFTESLQLRNPVPVGETCLLLVGRGSHDESATAEMHEFARLRSQLTPLGQTAVAFLAMAQPTVQETLPRLGADGWRRIVVQPHLLFHGELYDTLSSQVKVCQESWPGTDWIVTPYLSKGLAEDRFAADLLVTAIRDRAWPLGVG